MKKFFVAAALPLLLAAMLCGCSLRALSFDDILRPPGLLGENAELQAAFEAAVGSDVLFKYPSSGDYRSAFVLFDLDFDGEDEAVVFYIKNSLETVTNMNLLDRNGSQWISVADVAGAGSDIYEIAFEDLNGDGIAEILASWSLYDSKSTKIMSVYNCRGEGNTLYPKAISGEAFTSSRVLDMDGDGLKDIMLILLDSAAEVPTSTAKLFKMNDGVINLLGETKLDANIVSYSLIQAEKISEDAPMKLYLDASKGENQMITEVLYWDKSVSSLVNPLFDVATQSNIKSRRSFKLTSRDINGDGALEIPISAAHGASSGSASGEMLIAEAVSGVESVQLVNWCLLENAALVPVVQTVVNTAEKYILKIPDELVDTVSVYFDSHSSVCSVCLTEGEEILFTVTSLNANATELGGFDSEKAIGERVAAISVSDAGVSLGLDAETLMSGISQTEGE